MRASDISLIVNALLRTEDKDVSISIFNNKHEKRAFVAMLVLFILLSISAACYHLLDLSLFRSSAMIFALLFYLAAAVWQLALVAPLFSFFRNPTKNFLKEIENTVINEASSLISLGSVERESVEYMQKRLVLAQEQLSQRTNVLVGVVDKVGILPGLLSVIAALYELNGGKLFQTIDISIYENIAIVFIVFYIFYLVSIFIQQRFKIYALILEHRLEFGNGNSN